MGNHDIWDEIERAGTGQHLSEEMFEYISAYADGECNAKERRLVEAYVAENAEARALLADLRSQSAMVGEDMVDSPDWLRTAILRKTVEKRAARWPFAAGLAAATAAAAIVAVTHLPDDAPRVEDRGMFAQNDPQSPSVALAPETIPPPIANEPPTIEQIDKGAVEQPATRTRIPERNSTPLRTVSAPVNHPDPGEHDPVELEEKTATDTETYAVVEYGSGRFQPKQPDPIDGSATQPSETAKAAPRPEVLPDAREKLRDKVRKLNEEKLEVGEKEKSGS
jgi:hypothetical protein